MTSDESRRGARGHGGTPDSVARHVDDVFDDVLDLYLTLHQHPELSGVEASTARLLAAGLERVGAAVSTGLGGHGVVGVIRNGRGPTVMLRAELDALPVTESTGLPYASTVRAIGSDGRETGVMHACGHDVHLACLAGAAAVLSRTRDAWRGTILLVGQPAEETLSGARALLDAGLYDRFGKPDVALAQHTCALPAGMVAHAPGPILAGSATINITLHGRGGHAAAPHLAVDPVVIAANVVLRLQNLAAREAGRAEPFSLTVGSLHAGGGANVIPDEARLSVSVRSHLPARLEEAVTNVERIVTTECAGSGCDEKPEITVTTRSTPTVNDAPTGAIVQRAHRDAFGDPRVAACPPTMATEDFAEYGADGTVPLVYWMIGATGAAQWSRTPGSAFEKLETLPTNHSSRFAPAPTPTLRTGIAAIALAALACLEKPGLEP